MQPFISDPVAKLWKIQLVDQQEKLVISFGTTK